MEDTAGFLSLLYLRLLRSYSELTTKNRQEARTRRMPELPSTQNPHNPATLLLRTHNQEQARSKTKECPSCRADKLQGPARTVCMSCYFDLRVVA